MYRLVKYGLRRWQVYGSKAKRWGQVSAPVWPGLIAALVAIAATQIRAWQPLERLAYVALFEIRETKILPHLGWDPRIAVIAIDEVSLQQYGQFPWSRDRYTDLLQTLAAAPPAVIGFDILFAEPTSQDATLAQAIAHSWNVVLATAADYQGNPIWIVPELDAVAAQGHVLSTADPDGISRQFSLYLNQFPSLGITMLQVYNESLRQTIRAEAGDSERPVLLPDPSSRHSAQPAWINWPSRIDPRLTDSGAGQMQVYSFADVVEGKVNPDLFLDKIVLVGETGTALDPLRSPLNINPPISGIYLHAAVIDNLLNDRFLRRSPAWANLLLLLLLGPTVSALLFRQGPVGRLVMVVCLPLLWFAIALICFSGNAWIPIAAPIGLMLMTAGGVQWREQQEKQQLMNLLAMHVSPETAELLWQRKGEIFQGGELQAQEITVTVLFLDVRGFTALSEKLAPGDLMNWLNRYLEVMTDCIMDHGGVVDKYIGDAIVAVFGLPFAHTTTAEIRQDAINAIAASLAMQERLQPLNQAFAMEGKPLIEFGIGVHTGVVTAGSMGSSRRSNYSIVGDTVNIAIRLESMNKTLIDDNPNRLLVTGRTLAYVRDHYLTKGVGAIRLQGKETATVIYAIQAKRPAP